MKLTGKSLLLLLLYVPIRNEQVNVPIKGRTRLMKMVFLFEEEVLPDFEKDKAFDEINLPEFIGWKYGPFSKDLLNHLEFLINQKYIKVEISSTAPISAELDEYKYWIEDLDEFESREYDEEIFKLDEKGISKAVEFWSYLSENQKKLLVEFKRVLNRAPLDRILEYVYKKYKDDYIDKSLIREKYLS